MATLQPAVHEYSGKVLSRVERRWTGWGVEFARWQVAKEAAGLVHRKEHVVFATFAGRTARTSARIEGGERYRGADFPGAVTFIPSLRARRAEYGRGVLDYAAVWLDPARLGHLAARGDLGGLEPGRVEFLPVTNRPDRFVCHLLLALRSELHAAGHDGRDDDGAQRLGGDHLLSDSVATALLLHLLRRYSNRCTVVDRSVRRDVAVAKSVKTSLAPVIDYIREHLGDDLRLDVLADVAGMSRFQFLRAFKAATGTTPHRYVVDRRLERAAALLRDRSGLSIADIAHRTGFCNQSHLTTAFRRKYGLTPYAYRRSV